MPELLVEELEFISALRKVCSLCGGVVLMSLLRSKTTGRVRRYVEDGAYIERRYPGEDATGKYVKVTDQYVCGECLRAKIENVVWAEEVSQGA